MVRHGARNHSMIARLRKHAAPYPNDIRQIYFDPVDGTSESVKSRAQTGAEIDHTRRAHGCEVPGGFLVNNFGPDGDPRLADPVHMKLRLCSVECFPNSD